MKRVILIAMFFCNISFTYAQEDSKDAALVDKKDLLELSNKVKNKVVSISEIRNEIVLRNVDDTSFGGFANATLSRYSTETLYYAFIDGQKGIYGIHGGDNRIEPYQIKRPQAYTNTMTVAALVHKSMLRDNKNGTHTLVNLGTFEHEYGLCDKERFREQPVAAFCTAFGVSEYVVATAGHCVYNPYKPSQIAIVFGYQKNADGTINTTFNDNDIYYAVDTIARALNADTRFDYALLKLDRPLSFHRIAKINESSQIVNKEKVYVIGHPCGLPVKYADSAYVRDNTNLGYFVTNLDTYGGNSGSPVFNTRTHKVEGILVRGGVDFGSEEGTIDKTTTLKEHFIKIDDQCYRSVVCDDDGCRGEDVSRVSQFIDKLKPYMH